MPLPETELPTGCMKGLAWVSLAHMQLDFFHESFHRLDLCKLNSFLCSSKPYIYTMLCVLANVQIKIVLYEQNTYWSSRNSRGIKFTLLRWNARPCQFSMVFPGTPVLSWWRKACLPGGVARSSRFLVNGNWIAVVIGHRHIQLPNLLGAWCCTVFHVRISRIYESQTYRGSDPSIASTLLPQLIKEDSNAVLFCIPIVPAWFQPLKFTSPLHRNRVTL